MKIEKICKLCFKSKKKSINIFDQNGIKLNIVHVLKKHFWFKIIENNNNDDNLNLVVCEQCWIKTREFNTFYNSIELAHFNFMNAINNNNRSSQSLQTKVKNVVDDFDNKNNCMPLEYIKSETNCTADRSTTTLLNTTDSLQNLTDYSIVIINGIQCESTVDNNVTMIDTKPLNCISKIEENFNEILYINEYENSVRAEILESTIEEPKIEEVEQNPITFDNAIVHNSGHIKKSTKRKCIQSKKKLKRASKKGKNNKNNAAATEIVVRNNFTLVQESQIREFFKLECEICLCSFLTFPEIVVHYHQVHNARGYIICCQRKFFRRGKILEHIAYHLNPNAYKCQFCSKSYTDRYVLSNHIDTIHTPADGKPFKCDICQKSFSKKFQVTQHLKFGHLGNDKKHECEMCNKRFVSKYNLAAHVKSVHDKYYEQICDICAKPFKRLSMLQIHRETHFGIDINPKLQCNMCGAWVKKKSLYTHLAQHETGTRTCPICGKETVNKESLRNHLKYVHSEKKHICTMCSKAFKKPVELREHIASHTGEKLYTCPYCPKTFTCGPNMRAHRKNAHIHEWAEDRKKS